MESGLTNPPALIGTGAAKGVTSHQTKKGNQWYHRFAEGFAYGMKVHNRCAEANGYGVDS
jgi:transposase, IS5 family